METPNIVWRGRNGARSIRVEQYDDGEVTIIVLDRDAVWERSEHPLEWLTVDYDADDKVIGFEILRPPGHRRWARYVQALAARRARPARDQLDLHLMDASQILISRGGRSLGTTVGVPVVYSDRNGKPDRFLLSAKSGLVWVGAWYPLGEDEGDDTEATL